MMHPSHVRRLAERAEAHSRARWKRDGLRGLGRAIKRANRSTVVRAAAPDAEANREMLADMLPVEKPLILRAARTR